MNAFRIRKVAADFSDGIFICFSNFQSVHIIVMVNILRKINQTPCKGRFLILSRYKPFLFGSHNLGKERFVLFRQLGVLLQIGNELLTPETQAFHFLSVIILALFLPLWDKRTVRGQAVIIVIFDMGNQIPLAVANVKASVIVDVLSVNNSGNLKVGLVIPTDIFIALTLTVLFFIQNAKQLIPKSKAQIGKAVIQFPVIKGRVFRKTDREC